MRTRLRVNDELVGKRADIVASEHLPGLSRSYIRKLFDSGSITVNGQVTKPGYKVRINDQLDIVFDGSDVQSIDDIELPIVYEDQDVIVINKPRGVISHSQGRHGNEPSVASFIRQKTRQKGDRAGIVHRLDRGTSGVMICAKNPEVLGELQKQFSKRQVTKTYLAIVHGHLDTPEAIIDMPIERNPKKPQTFRVGAQGKAASTHYKVIKQLENYDVLELKPKTGRTHQLRVHLTHINHPIVGDDLYSKDKTKYSRMYLHAHKLSLKLSDGKRRTFVAPLPADFEEFLSKDV
jgi:23S rRNA pseudouridine1911/1915/1917 synthase